MSCVIVIRDYKATDTHSVSEVVRNAYLSNVSSSWYNALTREITFQLIVMSAAILFIFVGVPLSYCLFSIPIVLATIYFALYCSYFIKSAELMHTKKPLHCWVAEACEPFIFMQKPEETHYKIITENEEFDMGNYKRKVIGTVALANHLHLEDSAWLFRLAVNTNYRHKGIGQALVHTAQKWCRNQGYKSIELAMSECQEPSRQLFIDAGFEMRQMYHKQLMGSALTLLMYQLACDLNNFKPNL